jgi:hypothetical protein
MSDGHWTTGRGLGPFHGPREDRPDRLDVDSKIHISHMYFSRGRKDLCISNVFWTQRSSFGWDTKIPSRDGHKDPFTMWTQRSRHDMDTKIPSRYGHKRSHHDTDTKILYEMQRETQRSLSYIASPEPSYSTDPKLLHRGGGRSQNTLSARKGNNAICRRIAAKLERASPTKILQFTTGRRPGEGCSRAPN